MGVNKAALKSPSGMLKIVALVRAHLHITSKMPSSKILRPFIEIDETSMTANLN